MYIAPMSTSTNPFAGMFFAEDAAKHMIRSRFGEIAVDMQNAIMFPRGLLGLPTRPRFVLADFPSGRMQQFKLLQSLDEPELSFITLPLEVENPLIGHDDIVQACEQIGVPVADLALLLIVSVQRTPGDIRITVNARAPLFIDAARKVGAQYVFQNDRYHVQHVL